MLTTSIERKQTNATPTPKEPAGPTPAPQDHRAACAAFTGTLHLAYRLSAAMDQLDWDSEETPRNLKAAWDGISETITALGTTRDWYERSAVEEGGGLSCPTMPPIVAPAGDIHPTNRHLLRAIEHLHDAVACVEDAFEGRADDQMDHVDADQVKRAIEMAANRVAAMIPTDVFYQRTQR